MQTLRTCMATPIKSTIKRQIHLHGIEAPINLFIHPTGIEMTVTGARTKVFASWEHLAHRLMLPDNVPSKFHGQPYEFLKHLSTKKGQ